MLSKKRKTSQPKPEGGFALSLFEIGGYGLLLLSLVDTLAILIPPRFTDPAWELQTIGALADRVPVPLLGFLLVFTVKEQVRSKLQIRFLGALSWLALLIGLILLLLIPLGLSDFLRINRQTNTQIQAQGAQQLARLNQAEQQLKQATGAQIQQLAERLSPQAPSLETQDPQALKQQLLSQVATTETEIQAGIKQTQISQRNSLLKKVTSWCLQALIAGIVFIWIWRRTRWARRPKRWSP